MDKVIILTGTPGAGKTSAIGAISDTEYPVASLWSLHESAPRRARPKFALDHGLVRLDDGNSLHLYGVPWLGWPDFAWVMIAEMAAAFIILLDCRRPDPASDLETCLNTFGRAIANTGSAVAVGVTHGDICPKLDLRDDLCKRLDAMHISPCIPIFEVDGRSRNDVKHLLLVVAAMLDDGAGVLNGDAAGYGFAG
jgi:signal recognition particle receptor subunit beta